jgi:hypothetical protein
MGKSSHNIAGKKLLVSSTQILTPVSRQQGISVEFSPSKLLGILTTSTKSVNRLEGEAHFRGLESDFAVAECSSCGSIKIMAHTFWGGGFPNVWKGPPKPFSSAHYTIRLTLSGESHEVRGTVGL